MNITIMVYNSPINAHGLIQGKTLVLNFPSPIVNNAIVRIEMPDANGIPKNTPIFSTPTQTNHSYLNCLQSQLIHQLLYNKIRLGMVHIIQFVAHY